MRWPAVTSETWVRSLPTCGVYARGLDSRTGTEGSPVSCLICDRWQRLNSEAFNRCPRFPVDTDVVVCVGGARCLACLLPSGQFGLVGVGQLPWRTSALSGAEKRPWYRLGELTSISTKALPLITPTRAHTTTTHTHTVDAHWAYQWSQHRSVKSPPYT